MSKVNSFSVIRFGQTSGTLCTALEIFCLLLTFICGTFFAPFYFKHTWTYLDSINKAHRMLAPPKAVEPSRCLIATLVTLSVTVGVSATDIILWSRVITKDSTVLELLRNIIPFYLTYFYLMIRQIYSWTIIDCIRGHLAYLNSTLLEDLREKGIYEILANSNEYMDHNLVKIVKGNNSCKNDLKINLALKDDYEKVKKLVTVYDLLSNASTAANKHLGIFTLIILFGCLIDLLVTPYDLYIQTKYTDDYAFVGGQIIWMAGHIFRLIFLIQPCQACKYEQQQTARILCKILAGDLSCQTRRQLKLLLHRMEQCPIKFCAFGLVNIDQTLLTTVAGTVTTYLVILFQFK